MADPKELEEHWLKENPDPSFIRLFFVQNKAKTEHLFYAGRFGSKVLEALRGLDVINKGRTCRWEYSSELISESEARLLLDGRTYYHISVSSVVRAISKMSDTISTGDLQELFLDFRVRVERPCSCMMDVVAGRTRNDALFDILTFLNLECVNEDVERVVRAYYSEERFKAFCRNILPLMREPPPQ